MQEDTEPQAILRQELNVDERPHEPGHKSTDLNSGALQHCEILANNGKVAFIEVTKWWRGRMANHLADDGHIDLKLDRPVEMGGKGNGTNPEQLFAVGYAACFIGALRVVAGKRHMRIPEEVAIDSAVSFGPLRGAEIGRAHV